MLQLGSMTLKTNCSNNLTASPLCESHNDDIADAVGDKTRCHAMMMPMLLLTIMIIQDSVNCSLNCDAPFSVVVFLHL